MVGMLMYSHFCILENQQKSIETAAQALQVCLFIESIFIPRVFLLINWHEKLLCDSLFSNVFRQEKGNLIPSLTWKMEVQYWTRDPLFGIRKKTNSIRVHSISTKNSKSLVELYPKLKSLTYSKFKYHGDLIHSLQLV